MPGLLQPLGLIIGSWLLLFMLFGGPGMAVLRFGGQRLETGGQWRDSFWIGWALSLLFLQVWHIAFPVNDAAMLILAAGAAASIFRFRSRLASALRRFWRDKAFLLLACGATLWLASRAIEMPTAFDTGYRDMQAVMWMDAYAIAPGLGNLFASLAYNHPTYLYNALLDFGPFHGKSYYIATGLLLLVYLIGALHASLRLWRGRHCGGFRWSALFAMLTIPYALHYTVGRGGITHFLTDTAVDLLGFLTIIALLDFLQDWRPGNGRNYLIWKLAVFIAVGLICKHSYVVFGLSCAALAALIWLRRGGLNAGARSTLKLAGGLALLAASSILPWMARGVITSGYIAYPLSVGRVELDWTLSADRLEDRQRALSTNTRSYGGDSDEVLGSWAWLGGWLSRLASNRFHAIVPAALALSSLLLVAARRLGNFAAQPTGLDLWVLAPPAAMLVFWFLSFPNPKYARYLFWSFAALCVLLATLEWGHIAQGLRIQLAFALGGLCLVYVVYMIVRAGSLSAPPGPDTGFRAREQPAIRVFETDSGLRLNTPAYRWQCWDIPLPCTAIPDKRIYLRVAGDLGAGFGYADEGGPGR